MKIIGIGYRSSHGKDSVANFIIDYMRENSSLTAEKVSWAREVKNVAWRLYQHLGLRYWSFYETHEGRLQRNVKLPKINLTPVEIWIRVGQQLSDIYSDTWADYVLNNYHSDIIICPDTRRLIEANKCDYLIHVHDPRKPNREGLSMDDELENFNGWHYRIINDGSLELLQYNAETVIKDILKKIK